MGYQCDHCGEARSVVYCRSDAACLCLSCDRAVHSTNALSNRHSRTLVCDRCNLQPAVVRCVEEKVSLCQNCDWVGHNGTTPHSREALNCYSGCPSSVELSSIWSFMTESSSVIDSINEQGMGSMSIANNSQGPSRSNNNQDLLVNDSNLLTGSSSVRADDRQQNVVQQVGQLNSSTSKISQSGKRDAELCDDDGFYADVNMDEVDLSMENYEEQLFGVGHNDPDHFFAKDGIDCLFGGAESNSHGSYAKDVEHLKIPLQKLVLATNNFSKEYVIAKGGFGLVYKAQNEHGTIAVKKLDQRFGQGDREFMMEIAMLSAYTHENLVSLVGFCDEGDEKILVYKHESNGSLDQHLHRKDLTWIQRLQICLDVAQGLKYLHNDIGIQHRILHRDMKSSNILLDEKFTAKISDFGLSKIALANVPCTVLISKVCGTPGYVDPEYYKHGILTQKSDVYSFGVVMFEVLCGKLVGVSKHLDEPFSAELPQNCYEEGTLDEIIDSDLRNQMNSASLSTFSAIAHQCLKCRGRDRPTMAVVVEELKKALVYQQVASLE